MNTKSVRSAALVLVVCIVLGTFAQAFAQSAPAPKPAPVRVIVADFEARTHDERLKSLGRGIAEAVAVALLRYRRLEPVRDPEFTARRILDKEALEKARATFMVRGTFANLGSFVVISPVIVEAGRDDEHRLSPFALDLNQALDNLNDFSREIVRSLAKLREIGSPKRVALACLQDDSAKRDARPDIAQDLTSALDQALFRRIDVHADRPRDRDRLCGGRRSVAEVFGATNADAVVAGNFTVRNGKVSLTLKVQVRDRTSITLPEVSATLAEYPQLRLETTDLVGEALDALLANDAWRIAGFTDGISPGERIAAGRESLKAGEAARASLLFRMALPAPEAGVGLGEARLAQRRFPDAVTLLETALKSRQDAATYRALAQAHIGLKNYAQASKLLEDAVRRYPDDADLLLDLGLAYFQLGDLKAALATSEKAAAAAPDRAEAQHQVGTILALGLNNKDGAIQAYEAALARNPAFEPARNALASMYGDKARSAALGKRYSDAVDFFSRQLTYANLPQAYIGRAYARELGGLLSSVSDVSALADDYRAALALTPEFDTQARLTPSLNLLEALIVARRYEEASTWSKAVLNRYGNHDEGSVMARYLEMTGRILTGEAADAEVVAFETKVSGTKTKSNWDFTMLERLVGANAEIPEARRATVRRLTETVKKTLVPR